MFQVEDYLYFDTFWIHVLMFFYLILADFDSFSYRRLSIIWRSCCFTRRRDIIENIFKKASDFTILSDCINCKRTDWKNVDEIDKKTIRTHEEKFVFYEKYRELASDFC
jgi:hypothetical protein